MSVTFSERLCALSSDTLLGYSERPTMKGKGAFTRFFVLAASFAVFAKATPAFRSDASRQDVSKGTVIGDHSFLSVGLFEGDLKLAEKEIRRRYTHGIEDVRRHHLPGEEDDKQESGARADAAAVNGMRARDTRAVVGSDGSLWPNKVIRYHIATTQDLMDTIFDAMEKWEDETCLRFRPRRSFDQDYANFTTENVCGDLGACCSDAVGRKGGEQKVSLHRSYCNDKGIVMHLLGHVIGFWHEESRPDRDNYISINYDNIQAGALFHFQKRNELDVDYQGVEYDYASIMHLPLTVFANCHHPPVCPTMEVVDQNVYTSQGSPSIGQISQISKRDSEQAKRLYKCPGKGVLGRLRIHVYKGQNFLNSNYDSFVKVTAVDSDGSQVSMTTDTQVSTGEPNWNEDLLIGEGDWQFFHIQVVDNSSGSENPISMSETVVVKGDVHQLQDHCLTAQCSSKVRYLYHFVSDTDECSPNPCSNGGTCEDLFADFKCQCRPGWTGITCNTSLACNSMPCQNGGTCNTISDDNLGNYTYSCSCTSTWAGTNCDVELTCKTKSLQHGGTCNAYLNDDTGVSTYSCSCPPEHRDSALFARMMQLTVVVNGSCATLSVGTCSNDTTIETIDVHTSCINPDPEVLRVSMYASAVVAFSTKWDTSSYSAEQALGEHDVFPIYGDNGNTWCPSSTGQQEYLEFEFPEEVKITGISVYETWNGGAITKLGVWNKSKKKYTTVYEGVAQHVQESRIFEPSIQRTSFPSNRIRLDLDCSVTTSWVEIDAVKITGRRA